MVARFWSRAVVTWAVLVALAIGAGVLREEVYAPLLGRALAEWITLAKLTLLWLMISYGFLVWHRTLYRRAHLPWLGGLWVALALLLEYGWFNAVEAVPGGAMATLHGWWRGDLWVVHVALLYFAPLLMGRFVRPVRLGPTGHELRER